VDPQRSPQAGTEIILLESVTEEKPRVISLDICR